MIRAVRKLNNVRNVACARKFSTNPPPKNNGGDGANKAGENNNAFLIGSGAAIAGILYMAYALESDPDFAKRMADTPGISLLDPIRSGLVSVGVITKDANK